MELFKNQFHELLTIIDQYILRLGRLDYFKTPKAPKAPSLISK